MKDNPTANIAFVKCIQGHEVLYNFSSKGYGKKEFQDAAWRDVATQLNTTGLYSFITGSKLTGIVIQIIFQ